ncbi:MAG: DUF5916 domain-containing protein [Gemmatimonadaceae bacterium]
MYSLKAGCSTHLRGHLAERQSCQREGELSATPRAAAYDDRYAPYLNTAVTSDPGGFNFKQLQSNVVYRWEYNPGSTLFVVWNQGRQGVVGAEGFNKFQGDVSDLFRLHPANTFLVKVSYWLNR